MRVAAEDLRGSPIGIFRPSSERLARLGQWYEAEHAALVRFAFLLCGDLATAEDLVQEAFVKMYRSGARPEERGMKAYARATIVSVSRSAFRRRSREETAAQAADRPGPAPEMGTRAEMWNAIGALSPRQRAVTVLRFYEDMTEREIADLLGMSIGSVKKHSDRALKKLREQLGRDA